jgi:hypothetical protein
MVSISNIKVFMLESKVSYFVMGLVIYMYVGYLARSKS